MAIEPLKLHLKGVLVHQVRESDLATSWRNDLPVLATPVLLWLAELACMRAIEDRLEPGQMTLGYSHDINHLAQTPAGWTVTLEAELEQIQGRYLTYRLDGRDGQDVILSGRHIRAIVDRSHFIAKLDVKRGTHHG